MTKLLLYCTKAFPYLTRGTSGNVYPSCCISNGILDWHLNGKVVAECDFEVEHIWCELFLRETPYGMKPEYKYYTETSDDITKECCKNYEQMDDYLQKKDISYAIYVNNIHIFDEPNRLFFYDKKTKNNDVEHLYTAPKNMMYVYDIDGVEYILISVNSEELCRVLSGEQKIILRKKILKGMLENVRKIRYEF